MDAPGKRFTTDQVRSMFVDNFNDFDPNRMGLIAEAGLAAGIDGNSAITLLSLEEEQTEKRKQQCRAMQAANITELLDNMIADIDLQIEGIDLDISALEAQQAAIAQEKETLIQERDSIQGEADDLEALESADEARAAAAAKVESAQNAVTNATDPVEAMERLERLREAEREQHLCDEEYERRREVVRSRGIDPDKWDERLETVRERLETLDERIEQLELDEAKNASELARLRETRAELVSNKENLETIREHVDSPEIQAKITSGEYTNVGHIIDSLPPEKQTSVNSGLDNFVRSPSWASFEDGLYAAKDAVVETVTENIINPVSNAVSGAYNTITGYLTSEPDPTGDRAGTSSAQLNGDLHIKPEFSTVVAGTTTQPDQAPDVGVDPALEQQQFEIARNASLQAATL